MVVEGQAESPSTTFSNFDQSGLTVTIAASSGFSVGDYILAVENEGQAQEVAVGKITNISGSGPYTVTVDKWSGDQATMGNSGNIYELNGNDSDLGQLLTSTVKTTVSMVDITTNASDGYTCYIAEDGNLRTGGGADIDDVADGTVTAGSEEYGIEKVGDNIVGGGTDTAISTGYNNFADSSTFATKERNMSIHKASIVITTTAGDYAHNVEYYCTADF
jgi:hypothetical protein